MDKLNRHEENQSAEVPLVDMDRLSDIVEAELNNVAGGGYSEYTGYHKDTLAN